MDHLVLDHGAEVIVPEEHTQLSLLGGGVEFTQAVIRQLGGRRLQKLLRYQTCNHTTVLQGLGDAVILLRVWIKHPPDPT